MIAALCFIDNRDARFIEPRRKSPNVAITFFLLAPTLSIAIDSTMISCVCIAEGGNGVV